MSDSKYLIQTFGCRVNQADSAGIAADLERAGLSRTRSTVDAQVVVLNTCTVTHRSDADVRKAVSRLRREAPDAEVVVTGCFAQRDPGAASAIPGVSAVVGNAHKSRLPVLVDGLRQSNSSEPLIVHAEMAAFGPQDLPVEPVTTVLDRTRPFIKIQDGCNANCTYCIIPHVRGKARSADPAAIERAVRDLVGRGYFEVVLAGVHLGTFKHRGPDGSSDDLTAVVKRILAVPGLGRLRMSCIEPMAFPLELPRLARSNPRLAPHFHLPLQSGSDAVLKRMVRPYRAKDYIELMRTIRAEVPRACLGTDVIVGFPGESEADFQSTLDTVAAAGLDYVHVFSYSDRSGAPATRLRAKVDPRIIKSRASRLGDISRSLYEGFLNRQVGSVLPAVVLDDPEAAGRPRALTENFCNVDCRGDLSPGSNVELKILARNGARLVGEAA